jgi:glyoxylase-like metal-dependent hydrolase (beta-lactamase superfamily II)
MPAWICVACAVQYADTAEPPAECRICADDRQYVPAIGQQWTSIPELLAAGHRTMLAEVEPGLHSLVVEPKIGIGQHTLLARGSAGNLLWDPNGLLDDAGLEAVRGLGGIAAVSASHPHMYGSMVEWSRAFGGVPVLVPEADREWVTRPDPAIEFWSGRHEVLPGITLVQCGGHFRGSAAACWSGGSDGRGSMLAGDTVMVAADPRWVSFMRSYPNHLPLSGAAVRRISERLAPYEFDRLYDNFGRVVGHDAKAVVARSAERYSRWVGGEMDHLT